MKPSNKIVFFDNRCRVCRSGAKIASALGSVEQRSLTPLQNIEDFEMCNIDQSRYCNELAILDTQSKEVKYGMEGLLWFMEEKMGNGIRVFSFPPLFWLLQFLYRLFSYNRRMIAPVYSVIDNDCKPSFNWTYRLSYIFLATGISVCISYSMGNALQEYFTNVYHYLFVFGGAWLIYILMILLYRMENKMDYFGHLVTVMLSGVMVQIPFVLCFYWFGINEKVLLLSLIFSDILMTIMIYRRVNHLGLSQWMTFLWWLTLHVSAVVIFIFLPFE